jgi:murein L,D-transpeptidase YafK
VSGSIPRIVALSIPCCLPFEGFENPQADRILVRKARRELVLLHQDRVLKSYRVALGRNPVGPKRRQGDRKTPEGLYTITGRNPSSAFPRALRISYPSAPDRARARREGVSPGGDIMIHGLPNGQG